MAVAVIALIVAAAGGVLLLRRGSDQAVTAAPFDGATSAPASTPPTGRTPVTAASEAGPASFSEVYEGVAGGVVGIETTACQDGGVGSGFLVAPDLVATVGHVVDGAVSVVLRQAGGTTTGTVVGLERQSGLALVRSRTPLTGHVFSLSSTAPETGVDVAAIGYPVAGPEALTEGTISGQDGQLTAGTTTVTGLLETDATLAPSSSGGPLLLADGTAVGLVDVDSRGGGYAVPTATARRQLEAWQQDPRPVGTSAGCSSPVGPSSVTAPVSNSSGSADGPDITRAFAAYVAWINSGNSSAAYAVLSPSSQARTSYDTFRSGHRSSYIVTLEVLAVRQAAATKDEVEVQFTSLQDPVIGGQGQSCSDWKMTYTMVSSAGGWLIDAAKPHSGSPASC